MVTRTVYAVLTGQDAKDFLDVGKLTTEPDSDALGFYVGEDAARTEATRCAVERGAHPVVLARVEITVPAIGGLEGVSYPSVICYENRVDGRLYLRDLSMAAVRNTEVVPGPTP